MITLNGPYIVINKRVGIFYIVPLIAILVFFELPIINAIGVNLCFIAGFICKWFSGR
jgi:hypothetical protein